jgi:hypothetical protein
MRAHALCGKRAELSHQADPHPRAVPTGRHTRHAGARSRQPGNAARQAAGDRGEPPWRGRQRRDGTRGPRCARRLHADHGYHRHLLAQSVPVRQHRFQRGARLRTAHAGGLHLESPGRAPVGAGQQREGTGGAGESEERRSHLRLIRLRFVAAPVHGALQGCRRRRHPSRTLQGQRARRCGDRGERGQCDVRQHALDFAQRSGGQGAAARGHGREALEDVPQRPHDAGSGLPDRGRGPMVRPAGARPDAAGRDRQAECGVQRSDAGRDRAQALCRDRPRSGQRRAESDKWGKLIREKNIKAE